jgi:hypothetical protein
MAKLKISKAEKNSSNATPERMVNQLSGHPVAQASWHINVTIITH